MSNLGVYQWMTTTAKKVGGPVRFLLLVGTAGAALYKGGEVVVKQCVKTIKVHKKTNSQIEDEVKLHSVTLNRKSSEGLEFVAGDRFRVLESDGDSVLIEKIGDANNPYFVSADVLRDISDYNA